MFPYMNCQVEFICILTKQIEEYPIVNLVLSYQGYFQ